MDERTRLHAGLLVDHCTDVTATDDVLITAPVSAEALVVALYEELGKRGARPMTVWRNPRASNAYLSHVSPEDLTIASHSREAMSAADVVILIKAARNAAATSDVPNAVGKAASQAKQPILEERLDCRWVITQHPAPADAQRAEMSTASWREYVYDATLQDWEELASKQQRLADRLESGEQVRLRIGERTDLTFSIEGMTAYNDDATENLPGGEVATVPVLDSVSGRFAVDFPVRRSGRQLEDVWLEFEDGAVTDYGAGRNEALLGTLLDTDAGAGRLGEFGIGTNPGVDRISHNLLFDEKMGGTVHVALGRAMSECVPAEREANESAIHLDLLADVGEDAVVSVDDDAVLRDGELLI